MPPLSSDRMRLRTTKECEATNKKIPPYQRPSWISPQSPETRCRLTWCRESQTMLARTALFLPSTSFLFEALDAETPLRRGQGTALNAAQPILALLFDAMRQHYARAEIADLVPRSMLDCAQLERWLRALEALMLGPLALFCLGRSRMKPDPLPSVDAMVSALNVLAISCRIIDPDGSIRQG
jgi:hypothetical protein